MRQAVTARMPWKKPASKIQLSLLGPVCSVDRVAKISRHLRLSATPNQGQAWWNGMGGWIPMDA